MNARIVVVEDEEALGVLLRYNLEAEGYTVEVIDHGDEADLRLKEDTPDLIILDWMLPGISGVEICRRVRGRQATERLPILMLTARGEEKQRIQGLTTGADDYLVKPFSMAELMARVRSLLWRSNPQKLSDHLTAGDIKLDRANHRAYRNGRELKLGPTEFKLLQFFMISPGRVFSREQLLDGVWGRDIYVDERTVDVHIGRLRKAINRGRQRDPVRTVRGAGYSFDEHFAAVVPTLQRGSEDEGKVALMERGEPQG